MTAPLFPFDNQIVLQWNQALAAQPWLGQLATFAALYGVYLIPLIWLVWWFATGKKQRLVLLSSLLAGVVAWQVVNRVIKLFHEQARPVSTLPVRELLFERPENSFPSDHAAFLASIAFFLLFQDQRANGLALLGLALVVGAARVAVAVHYPSDIVVGMLCGLVVAWVVHRLHRVLSEGLWERCLAFAHRLHLA